MSASAKPANQNAPGHAPRTIRSERRPQVSRRDQEFLPAALEILETPPSPVRMSLLLAICAFATIALAWAYLGRIDIVAVAQGKIQPTGRVKVVQPLESGRVRTILVENGQHVNAGDVLVELDPTEAAADEAGLQTGLEAYRAEAVRRIEAIRAIEASEHGQEVLAAALPLKFAPETPKAIRVREERVLMGDLTQLRAMLESLRAQMVQKEAERARLQGAIAVQRELIATLTERVTMRTILAAHATGSKASLIDATETLQTQQGTLATQLGQLEEAEAGLKVLTRERAKTCESFIADNGQKLADAERQVDDLEQRLAKAHARTGHMTLRAPLSGVVQSSSITTVGQVVMPSEELMRLVPDSSRLEIEAYLQNKDIGFVRTGQEAMVKIESFPFTRYGTITGRVVRVATDAIPEPDAQQIEGNPVKNAKANGFTGGGQRTQNLVFPIAIQPEVTNIAADGVLVPLSPGMAVSIEIKTGRRRILEYLFSPLVETGMSALHER